MTENELKQIARGAAEGNFQPLGELARSVGFNTEVDLNSLGQLNDIKTRYRELMSTPSLGRLYGGHIRDSYERVLSLNDALQKGFLLREDFKDNQSRYLLAGIDEGQSSVTLLKRKTMPGFVPDKENFIPLWGTYPTGLLGVYEFYMRKDGPTSKYLEPSGLKDKIEMAQISVIPMVLAAGITLAATMGLQGVLYKLGCDPSFANETIMGTTGISAISTYAICNLANLDTFSDIENKNRNFNTRIGRHAIRELLKERDARRSE